MHAAREISNQLLWRRRNEAHEDLAFFENESPAGAPRRAIGRRHCSVAPAGHALLVSTPKEWQMSEEQDASDSATDKRPGNLRKRIDELYKLPQNDEAYAPEQFVGSLQQLQAELDRGG
jgi:hypothetical protein